MRKAAIIIVLSVAGILAAYLFYYYSDPNIINEDYLSSEAYTTLQDNIQYERDSLADREAVLQEVVKQMLVQKSRYRLGLPYRLDSLVLDSVLKKENRLSLPDLRIMPSDVNDYTFYGLHIFEGEHYSALLSLIEMPGVYRDLEVGLTTVREGNIIDTALIGRYEHNLSATTHSEIIINTDHEIRIKVNKTRLYPFKQEQSVNYQYRIAKNGKIESNIL